MNEFFSVIRPKNHLFAIMKIGSKCQNLIEWNQLVPKKSETSIWVQTDWRSELKHSSFKVFVILDRITEKIQMNYHDLKNEFVEKLRSYALNWFLRLHFWFLRLLKEVQGNLCDVWHGFPLTRPGSKDWIPWTGKPRLDFRNLYKFVFSRNYELRV